MKHVVARDDAGKRLDVVASALFPDSSRSHTQKLIKNGLISVNDKKVPPHHFLKEGDVIVVQNSFSVIPATNSVITPPHSVIPAKAGIQPGNFSATPRVIDRTPEYIIIDKPAGMVVHSGVKQERNTLVDWLIANYPEIQKVGADPLRPGIVHRLDKDASGVMVVARTQESFDSLIRQFKLRQVEKEYRVLAHGTVTPHEGVINFPIGRSKQQYTKHAAYPATTPAFLSGTPASHPVIPAKAGIQSRFAVTKYTVIEQMENASLVSVIPQTGRTHQIRVHFFAKGNPIIGDRIYTSKKYRHPKRSEKSRRFQNARLMLHAERLGFRDLAGKRREYSSLPDEDFQKVLAVAQNA